MLLARSERGLLRCWLVTAAERRATPAATAQELTSGHGAAALLIGRGELAAKLLGGASLTVDFVDHFRPAGVPFDYEWEERWVRDEGVLKIAPRAIGSLLDETG